MTRFLKKLIFLLFFSCLILQQISVFAGGSRTSDLAKADALIKEKKYDDAIKILSNFSKQNPFQFEKAQKRLRQIYEFREEFNRTAEELIHIFLTDPDNSQKILALSNRIREMEDSSSPLLLSFVEKTREIAEFNVAKKRLLEILEKGRALLDEGESEAALELYKEAAGFFREEFFKAGYGGNIENTVLSESQKVLSAVDALLTKQINLKTLSAELINRINQGEINSTNITVALNNLTPEMDRYAQYVRDIYSAVYNLNIILEKIKIDNPDMGDRNYLSFFARAVYGRHAEDAQEGILGSFESYWNNSIGLITDAIVNNAGNSFISGLSSFKAGEYTASSISPEKINLYRNFSRIFFEKHILFNEDRNILSLNVFDNYIHKNDIPRYISMMSLNEAANYLTQAANIAMPVTTLDNNSNAIYEQYREGRILTIPALNNERQTQSSINGIKNSLSDIISAANISDASLDDYYRTQYIKIFISSIDWLQSSLNSQERQSVTRYYTIANNDLERSLNARKKEMESGKSYLNGFERRTSDNTIHIDYYPNEAYKVFTQMLSALADDLQRGNAFVDNYNNEPAALLSDRNIISLKSTTVSTVNELNNIRTEGISLSDTSRNMTSLADAYKQEGERLFREAQNAYQIKNFDVARDRLQRASDRFNNSMEMQESPSLRQSWDTQLINLGQAITIAENQMIVAEVRNLINNAQTNYFAGNFQQAEDYLIRAKNRWRITNPRENEEVLYWLGIVSGAMSARTGRVIPSTAPLYPEMSQLLSQANKNYEEGVRLINARNRSAGLEKFNEASRLAREVKLIFPINQDAGILELKIEQFTNPSAFNASFDQKLQKAIAGVGQRSIESFADLQNLAEINPRYPGINSIIYQAEINMGYRLPPPKPADIERSKELAASASRILDNNSVTLYDVALTQINEAIALNPGNTEAARVKDSLLNRMSVPGAIVLTSQDENEYQRAVRELQAGNNLVALAVVERLMQNPQNRNITKLIELQRRIQSVLL